MVYIELEIDQGLTVEYIVCQLCSQPFWSPTWMGVQYLLCESCAEKAMEDAVGKADGWQTREEMLREMDKLKLVYERARFKVN